jgi:hypothetical protein
MRVALLISGHARFCETFDVQLASLKNFSQVDWFVTLWDNKGQDERFPIAPSWLSVDNDRARALIEARLPPNHHLVHVDIRDPELCPPNPYNVPGWYYDETRLWQQYTILRWCDQARQQHEQQQGKYDVVIRTRPDVLIMGEVDLNYWGNVLKENPKWVILPYPDRSGSRGFNDRFGFCSSDGMTDYTNAIDLWANVHQKGVPWNPEELTGAVMMEKGYSWPVTNFNSQIRQQYGYWTAEHPTPNRLWIPNFGQWA